MSFFFTCDNSYLSFLNSIFSFPISQTRLSIQLIVCSWWSCGQLKSLKGSLGILLQGLPFIFPSSWLYSGCVSWTSFCGAVVLAVLYLCSVEVLDFVYVLIDLPPVFRSVFPICQDNLNFYLPVSWQPLLAWDYLQIWISIFYLPSFRLLIEILRSPKLAQIPREYYSVHPSISMINHW